MAHTSVKFLSLLLAALALVPTLAHALELPNKMGLSRDEYQTVQQIYRGWSLLGFVVAGALVSTLTLTFMARRRHTEFYGALVAFACLVGTQVVFWTFTSPANQQTQNWTVLSGNWSLLRAQWEYSHAFSAVLNLLALVAVIASVLAGGREQTRRAAERAGSQRIE